MKTTPLALVFLFGVSSCFGAQISENQQKFVEHYKHQQNKVDPDEALINTSPEPDLTEGFAHLYNGENLDGWVPLGGECTFTAKGDKLVGTVKTWINGVPATHWKTDEYREGFFSLQVHSGPEGIVHFRNIKVKEVTP